MSELALPANQPAGGSDQINPYEGAESYSTMYDQAGDSPDLVGLSNLGPMDISYANSQLKLPRWKNPSKTYGG